MEHTCYYVAMKCMNWLYEVYNKCVLKLWVITRVTELCEGIESELVGLIWSDEGLETVV